MRLGRIQRQCRRCLIVHDDEATMDQLRQWVWARRVLLERLPIRALRSIGAKRVKRPVGHRLYAESEDAGCMVGLQAAELPSVDETAITDTATSPPKPKNSARRVEHRLSIGDNLPYRQSRSSVALIALAGSTPGNTDGGTASPHMVNIPHAFFQGRTGRHIRADHLSR
jgi:hypothetical protein